MSGQLMLSWSVLVVVLFAAHHLNAKKCPPDRFGRPDCRDKCTCLHGAYCDSRDGHCTCATGYTGINCEYECPPDSYGPDCRDKCTCLHGAHCDSRDGHCTCVTGYYGINCKYIQGPSKPQNIRVRSSKMSMDITWEEPAMPNGDIIDYKVTYKFQKSMTETESKSVTAKELDVKLTKLYPGVRYEIEISARTGPGYGDVATISVQTFERKPQIAPENLSTTPFNSTTLNASWTSIPRYLQGGILRHIIITWKQFLEIGDPKERYLDATATSFAIAGLEPYTAYTITISATTYIGRGPVKKLEVTTPEGTPTKPLNVDGKSVKHSADEQSIQLRWGKPKNENGFITIAQVVYQKIAICTSLKCKRSLELNVYHYENVTTNVLERHYVIKANLDLFSQFGIRIREGTRVGWGEYSDEIIVSTTAGRPSEPVNVTLVESTHDSIFIKWEKPRKENGIIQHYFIYTKTGSQLVDKATLKVTDNTPLQYIIKQNIEPSTSYSIQVFAETNCNCGEGIGSRPLPVLTPVGPAKFPLILVLVVCLVVVLLIALVVATFLLVKRRHQKDKEVKQESISMANVMRSKPVLVDELKDNCMQQHANSDHIISPAVPMKILKDEWEIDPDQLTFGEKLGEGSFGNVFLAEINDVTFKAKISSERNKFAVKVTKDFATELELREFYKEIDLMKKIGYHKHIANMIGYSTKDNKKCLIMEYIPNGDLLKMLRAIRENLHETNYVKMGHASEDINEEVKLLDVQKNFDEGYESFSQKDLLQFARQIAVGMEYLASINLIHRDLAARNVLVGYDNQLKISDFGLTRHAEGTEQLYHGKTKRRLPIRWMSVEAIYNSQFTIYSDVWSYGVTLFEIVTLGGTPYPGMNNHDIMGKIKTGYRMGKPDNCTDEIYDIMKSCWQQKPKDRPSFTELREIFEKKLSEKGGYVTLDVNPNENYYLVPSFHSMEEESNEHIVEVDCNI